MYFLLNMGTVVVWDFLHPLISRSFCEVATAILRLRSPPLVDQSSSLATSTRRRPAMPG